MNVLIFAAGLGTRLRPLTDAMPKALVPVGGKPLLQLLIEKLKAANSQQPIANSLHIVVNVHHFADMVIDFLRQHDNFGVDIRVSDERDMLLETGGGLKKALPLFPNDDPVLIHNVDIFSNVDLAAFYAQAKANADAAATLLVGTHKEAYRFLIFNEDGNLVGWTNTNTGEYRGPIKDRLSQLSSLNSKVHTYAFSGIHVVNPKIIQPLMHEWEGKFSITDFYLSACETAEIKACVYPELKMIDVGTVEMLNKLTQEDLC